MAAHRAQPNINEIQLQDIPLVNASYERPEDPRLIERDFADLPEGDRIPRWKVVSVLALAVTALGLVAQIDSGPSRPTSDITRPIDGTLLVDQPLHHSTYKDTP